MYVLCACACFSLCNSIFPVHIIHVFLAFFCVPVTPNRFFLRISKVLCFLRIGMFFSSASFLFIIFESFCNFFCVSVGSYAPVHSFPTETRSFCTFTLFLNCSTCFLCIGTFSLLLHCIRKLVAFLFFFAFVFAFVHVFPFSANFFELLQVLHPAPASSKACVIFMRTWM